MHIKRTRIPALLYASLWLLNGCTSWSLPDLKLHPDRMEVNSQKQSVKLENNVLSDDRVFRILLEEETPTKGDYIQNDDALEPSLEGNWYKITYSNKRKEVIVLLDENTSGLDRSITFRLNPGHDGSRATILQHKQE